MLKNIIISMLKSKKKKKKKKKKLKFVHVNPL